MAKQRNNPVKNDRLLSMEVRTLTLKKIKYYLEHGSEEIQLELIGKLASSALPRINQHEGQDGGPISLKIVKYDGDHSSA